MSENYSGTLVVKSFAASEAFPVGDSLVTVRGADENNSDIFYTVFTDIDGLTTPITLPAPQASLSLSPNQNEAVYSGYDVTVSHPEYYTKTIKNVAVFSGVSSILEVNMIPYVPFEDGGSYPRGNINSVVTENESL